MVNAHSSTPFQIGRAWTTPTDIGDVVPVVRRPQRPPKGRRQARYRANRKPAARAVREEREALRRLAVAR